MSKADEELITEACRVAEGMEARGGGFVKRLGLALFKADLENMRKIRDTWPEYWATYLRVGKERRGEL